MKHTSKSDSVIYQSESNSILSNTNPISVIFAFQFFYIINLTKILIH